MDNDVQGTEYCIGFSTAITRAKEAINRQRTTLGSHERIGVFRIFGRDAGFSALYTAYVTSARCVIPEAPVRPRRAGRAARRRPRRQPEPLRLRHHRRGRDLAGRPDDRRRRRRRVRPSPQGERRRGAGRRDPRARTGIETLASELTYDLRSGEPDSIDSMVATTFANVAMDLVEGGVTGRMVAIQDGKYAHAPLPDPALGPRKVDVPSHVQRRALPAALRRQARRPDAAGRPRLSGSARPSPSRADRPRIDAGQGGHVVVAVAAGDQARTRAGPRGR